MRKTVIQKIKDKEGTGGNSLHMTAYLCSVSVESLVCMYVCILYLLYILMIVVVLIEQGGYGCIISSLPSSVGRARGS